MVIYTGTWIQFQYQNSIYMYKSEILFDPLCKTSAILLTDETGDPHPLLIFWQTKWCVTLKASVDLRSASKTDIQLICKLREIWGYLVFLVLYERVRHGGDVNKVFFFFVLLPGKPGIPAKIPCSSSALDETQNQGPIAIWILSWQVAKKNENKAKIFNW